MIPRPYQIEACDSIQSAGIPNPIVEMATGLGKTPTMALLSERLGGRTLVLVHRDELVQQTLDKFKQVSPNLRAGVVKAERNELDAPLVVASTQTLIRANRSAALFDGAEFSVAHIDEVQHYADVGKFGEVVRAIPAPLKIGWTATAYRTQGKLVGDLWEKIVYTRGILWGIQQGYLCDLRATQVSLNVDLRGVRVRGGDFSEEDLGRALAGASEAIAAAYASHAENRKGIIFTASVQQAHEVAKVLSEVGIPAASVWGEQDLERRRDTLQKFSEGKLRVLTNCAVLCEGYDEPSIECVMMARPTLSKLFYQQCIGRGTRLYPGKADCLVLDLRPQTEREPESMASMFGITERAAERGIEALLAEAAQDKHSVLVCDEKGQFAEDTIYRPPSGRLHWVPDGRRFLLSLGDATLALVPAGLTWEIKEFGRGKEAPTKKLYSGLSLDYAQGVAEDLVRSAGSWALASEGAHWRSGPPSAGQMRVFADKGWGLPRSKGAAADRMTVEFNRRRT